LRGRKKPQPVFHFPLQISGKTVFPTFEPAQDTSEDLGIVAALDEICIQQSWGDTHGRLLVFVSCEEQLGNQVHVHDTEGEGRISKLPAWTYCDGES
jgi:hypothetical protein